MLKTAAGEEAWLERRGSVSYIVGAVAGIR